MSTAPVQQPLVPNAVLDTNVGVTIYSWHDLLEEGDRLLKKNPTATLADPALAYRRRRARTAFFLVLFLNEHKWKVLAPLNEYQRTLLKNVAPDSATSNFTRLYLYFIGDLLLPDWAALGDLADDANIMGTDVDLFCLAEAQRHRIPLISWEGDAPTGPKPGKLIPQQAKARGIDLVTPEQLLQRHQFSEGPAVKRFFDGWDAHAAQYVKGNPSARETLALLRDFFERLRDDYWGP
jgi:hypothetical protein